MRSIIIHAGMGKAGSSSIQAWLAGMATKLLEQKNFAILYAFPKQTVGKTDWSIDIQPCGKNRVVSNDVVVRYFDPEANKAILARSFTEKLLRIAEEHEVSVVTAEAFSHLFFNGDEIFLNALNDLASSAQVRIAYYVRPQHTGLEAAWRQWGFRNNQSPSQFLRERCRQMHYSRTISRTLHLAPQLSFEVRPFTRELLVNGDVVTDFGTHFLGLQQEEIGNIPWANRGLPLEVVNLLSCAPNGLFWRGPHDNRNLARIKQLLTDLNLCPDDHIEMSRRLLQKFCFEEFEAENQEIIKKFNWNIDNFIPSPDINICDKNECLRLIDRYWKPSATDNELRVLFKILEKALAYQKSQ